MVLQFPTVGDIPDHAGEQAHVIELADRRADRKCRTGSPAAGHISTEANDVGLAGCEVAGDEHGQHPAKLLPRSFLHAWFQRALRMRMAHLLNQRLWHLRAETLLAVVIYFMHDREPRRLSAIEDACRTTTSSLPNDYT